MRNLVRNFVLPSLVLFASTLNAAPVSLTSQFSGGIFGFFELNYTSGAAGLKLQEVTIDLKSPLFLDPTFLPPGALLPLPFATASGAAATGFSGISNVFDGATSFTLLFNDFDAGESFGFNLDVDGPCNSIFCLGSASLTNGAEFAGSKLTGVFGGTGYQGGEFDTLYQQIGPNTAKALLNGDVEAVPEPATYAMLGGGLMLLGLMRRKYSV